MNLPGVLLPPKDQLELLLQRLQLQGLVQTSKTSKTSCGAQLLAELLDPGCLLRHDLPQPCRRVLQREGSSVFLLLEDLERLLETPMNLQKLLQNI